MRNYFFACAILLVSFLLGTGKVFAQETMLNIEAPPAGSLSAEQLSAVATDIRRMEANPLASDAKEATQVIMKWIIDSPDISISLCADVLDGLIGSESTYHGTLLTQFMFSSAAYIIENPDQAEDKVKINLGGLEGVINTYNVLKAEEGDAANDEFGEMLLNLKEEGKLEEHVVKALEGC